MDKEMLKLVLAAAYCFYLNDLYRMPMDYFRETMGTDNADVLIHAGHIREENDDYGDDTWAVLSLGDLDPRAWFLARRPTQPMANG